MTGSLLHLSLPIGLGLAAFGSGVGLGRAVGSAMELYVYKRRLFAEIVTLIAALALPVLAQNASTVPAGESNATSTTALKRPARIFFIDLDLLC